MNYGSYISNCFFYEELSRIVGCHIADEWLRHQKALPSSLMRASSCHPIKNQKIQLSGSNGGVSKESSIGLSGPIFAQTPFHNNFERASTAVQMAMKDETAELCFLQIRLSQPDLQAIDIRRARDTSSLLSSLYSPRTAVRLVKASCGTGSSMHSDRSGAPGNIGLLFTDAAHTILDYDAALHG
jgi:hypothetical protein